MFYTFCMIRVREQLPDDLTREPRNLRQSVIPHPKIEKKFVLKCISWQFPISNRFSFASDYDTYSVESTRSFKKSIKYFTYSVQRVWGSLFSICYSFSLAYVGLLPQTQQTSKSQTKFVVQLFHTSWSKETLICFSVFKLLTFDIRLQIKNLSEALKNLSNIFFLSAVYCILTKCAHNEDLLSRGIPECNKLP